MSEQNDTEAAREYSRERSNKIRRERSHKIRREWLAYVAENEAKLAEEEANYRNRDLVGG
jgi:hypothetical protein